MSVDELQDLAEHIEESLDGAVLSHTYENGEIAFNVKREEIIRVLRFLKDDPECKFDMLLSVCLLYTSPSPRDKRQSRMPSSA